MYNELELEPSCFCFTRPKVNATILYLDLKSIILYSPWSEFWVISHSLSSSSTYELVSRMCVNGATRVPLSHASLLKVYENGHQNV